MEEFSSPLLLYVKYSLEVLLCDPYELCGHVTGYPLNPEIFHLSRATASRTDLRFWFYSVTHNTNWRWQFSRRHNQSISAYSFWYFPSTRMKSRSLLWLRNPLSRLPLFSALNVPTSAGIFFEMKFFWIIQFCTMSQGNQDSRNIETNLLVTLVTTQTLKELKGKFGRIQKELNTTLYGIIT